MLSYRLLWRFLSSQLPCLNKDPDLKPLYDNVLLTIKREELLFARNNVGKSATSFEVSAISPAVKQAVTNLGKMYAALYMNSSVPESI